MSRQEAHDQYSRALKLGQRAYKDSVLHGRYPYPPVLDEILMDDTLIAGQADMGIIAACIADTIRDFDARAESIREQVNALCARYPLYQ